MTCKYNCIQVRCWTDMLVKYTKYLWHLLFTCANLLVSPLIIDRFKVLEGKASKVTLSAGSFSLKFKGFWHLLRLQQSSLKNIKQAAFSNAECHWAPDNWTEHPSGWTTNYHMTVWTLSHGKKHRSSFCCCYYGFPLFFLTSGPPHPWVPQKIYIKN